MGNDNKNEESARDFTDDFMHALKNMDNGGNEHDDSSVPYGDSLKSDMLKSFENCLETDLPKKDHATIRAIRTHLLLKEKENEEYHFLQRAMTSLKAIVIGG